MTSLSNSSDIVADLTWRGLITQHTEGALAALVGDPITYYVGFDPTAASLHVGHLTQVLTQRRLQQAGHHPLALVGGATGLIGDPRMSGERVLVDADQIRGWTEKIRAQIEPFLQFDGPNPARMVNNLDWTASMSAIDLLRGVGKHFSVNRMLDKESVKARLAGTGISFTEFSYQVLQAHDFLQLYRTLGCVLQFGGNDQWGNITAGVDLIRRAEAASAHAFTTPLVTKADGTKFGKTEGGAVWLDASMTSPYAFYQFWVNSDDRDVSKYLRFFSFKAREEIEELERSVLDKPAARLAQQALAHELTAMLHGSAEADAVVAASQALFGRGQLRELPEATLAAAVTELPRTHVAAGAGQWPTVVELLVACGVCGSRGEARRAINEGGAYLNNQRVIVETQLLRPEDMLHGRFAVLRRGKRTLAAVEKVG